MAGKSEAKISTALVEELTPQIPIKTKNGNLRLYCPGRLPIYRAETFFTKEPETLEWIDDFEENAVFWDIGANIGIYSLYAGLKKRIEVLAFEPAAPNFYLLNRNIEINQLENKITSFGIAFNDVTQLDHFFMSNTEIGSALHSFSKATDWKGQSFSPKFKQGMIGFTIDEFIKRFDPKFPTYIKIDVDGIEKQIVEGAVETLNDIRLKSILVELDESQPEISNTVISILENAGLKLCSKQHSALFDNTEYSSVYNHIFRRS
ncbi:MAG: FkbM family methyltransferase [Nitrospinota bacterium]